MRRDANLALGIGQSGIEPAAACPIIREREISSGRFRERWRSPTSKSQCREKGFWQTDQAGAGGQRALGMRMLCSHAHDIASYGVTGLGDATG